VDALIADPVVDAVGVCIPAGRHWLAVLPLLTAGKYVLVEKPPGLDLSKSGRSSPGAARGGVTTRPQ